MQGCSTGTVEDDGEEVELGEVGPTSVNNAANTIGIVQKHFKKINKSDVDPDLNTIEDDRI